MSTDNTDNVSSRAVIRRLSQGEGEVTDVSDEGSTRCNQW